MSDNDQHQFKDRYMLRLPDGLRDRIRAAAEAANRSMNAELVALLLERYPPPAEANADRQQALQDLLDGAAPKDLPDLIALANRVLAGDGSPDRFALAGDGTVRLVRAPATGSADANANGGG